MMGINVEDAFVALLKADDCCPLAFKIDPEDMRLRLYGEVFPRSHGMQKCRGRAMALAVALSDLVETNALLLCAVEIRIPLEARFFSCGDKRF